MYRAVSLCTVKEKKDKLRDGTGKMGRGGRGNELLFSCYIAKGLHFFF